jgi:hypothetical protein
MKILKFICAVALCGSSSFCLAESPIEGVWISNAERTIKSIKSTKSLSEEQRAVYGRMFGKFKLEFEAEYVVVDRGLPGPPASYREPYKIEGSGPDSITVIFGKPDDTPEKVKYYFEDNCIKRQIPGEEWFEYLCNAN